MLYVEHIFFYISSWQQFFKLFSVFILLDKEGKHCEVHPIFRDPENQIQENNLHHYYYSFS